LAKTRPKITPKKSPKKNRKKLIAAIIITAIIVGGVSSFFLFFQGGNGTLGPDFSLTVKIGDPRQSSSSWTQITNATTFLNGTTVHLVVVASGIGQFNDSVQLSFTSPSIGVTGSMQNGTLHPCPRCLPSVTGLNLTISSNIAAQKGSYKFNVTGTSASTKHTVIFPLRIWSSTLQVTPSSLQVLKPSTFKVSIGVSDFYNFQAFQFSINFNKLVVRAVNDTLAPIFYPPGTNVYGTVCSTAGYSSPCNCSNIIVPCDGYVPQNTLNNTIGKVTIAATLLGPCFTAAPCVDSPGSQVFTIANVTFAADLTSPGSSGNSGFKLTDVILTEVEGSSVNPFQPPNGLRLSGQNATVAYRGTSTVVSCQSPVIHGMATTCTATVTDTSSGTAVTPTGSVTFTSNNTTGTFSSSGTCTLSGSGGSATCSVMYTPNIAGTYLISATYTGDAVHSGSTGPPFDLIAT